MKTEKFTGLGPELILRTEYEMYIGFKGLILILQAFCQFYRLHKSIKDTCIVLVSNHFLVGRPSKMEKF